MEPLITTKLYMPPGRPGLVARERLLARLDEGLRCPLTLISAPAGFGKTTLAAAWAARLAAHPPGSERTTRIAWLSLDEHDADPIRFLVYVMAALRAAEANLAERTSSLLQSLRPPPLETVLTALINEIATWPATIVLILDDYHTIQLSAVDDALSFLLEHLPSQMHIVILTREDPPLPLARLRGQGCLMELRATELRFARAEVGTFLNDTMGLNLSQDDVAALEVRTEGWIAGLQLAAINLQGHQETAGVIRSFTGSHRFVLDYLIEEVLEQQCERVQEFLLQTAILNRLTGALCDALTGQNDGQATLQMLERSNLFIVPLDAERRWYRYHRLFGELLRARLRITRPCGLPVLHRRASRWYAHNGFAGQAAEHAQAAANADHAASRNALRAAGVETSVGG